MAGCSISIRSSPLLPIFLIFSLLIPTAFSDDSPLLYKLCTNASQNYTENSPFAKNLKNLLNDLYSRTPGNHGFRNATSGEGGGDTVYGLALCRGDVSPDECEDCLYDSRCKITRHCNKRAAIVWYDYCYLRYSGDEKFFGQIDSDDAIIMVNVKNASHPESFNATAVGLLTDLSRNAMASKYMFARGETLEKVENVTIFGMAQCSGDLSRANCAKCLDGAVKELPIYKGEFFSVGGRFLGASCNVRYEIYTFLKSSVSV